MESVIRGVTFSSKPPEMRGTDETGRGCSPTAPERLPPPKQPLCGAGCWAPLWAVVDRQQRQRNCAVLHQLLDGNGSWSPLERAPVPTTTDYIHAAIVENPRGVPAMLEHHHRLSGSFYLGQARRICRPAAGAQPRHGTGPPARSQRDGGGVSAC